VHEYATKQGWQHSVAALIVMGWPSLAASSIRA
jgi:hypothetical protein